MPDRRMRQVFVLLVVLFAVRPVVSALPAKYGRLGPALGALGYDHAAWRWSIDEPKGWVSRGFMVTPADYVRRKDWLRYGYDCSRGIVGRPQQKPCPAFAGPWQPERISVGVLVAVARAKDNPLGLTNNRTWTPKEIDIKDLLLAYKPRESPDEPGEFAYDMIPRLHADLPFDPSILSTGEVNYELAPLSPFAVPEN